MFALLSALIMSAVLSYAMDMQEGRWGNNCGNEDGGRAFSNAADELYRC